MQSICAPKRFAEYGLLTLPGVVIDGKVESAGQALTTGEIVSLPKHG